MFFSEYKKDFENGHSVVLVDLDVIVREFRVDLCVLPTMRGKYWRIAVFSTLYLQHGKNG